MAKFAKQGIEKIFIDGFDYKKAGVIAGNFTQAPQKQLNLFENEPESHEPLMRTVDRMNKIFGVHKVKLASQDLGRVWKMRQEKLSPLLYHKMGGYFKSKMKITRMPVLGDDLKELPIKHDGERYYVEKHDYISAGFPSPAADFQGEKISLDEKYIKPNSTFILECGGNSMAKTFLIHDKLICHSDVEIYHNAPVIVSVNFFGVHF